MKAIRQQRPSRRAVLCGLAFAASLRPAAAAEGASAWAESSHSAMRLVDGGAAAERGAHWFGLVLRLTPGFKTYWRHPGDSGVPPVLTFDGSTNLRSATVHFPAPKRFDDGAGGTSFGYEVEEVVLPLLVVADDPQRPVSLRVHADYAVCEKLCVPASGSAALTASGSAPFAGSVRRALAAVPVRAAVGDPGALAVMGLRKGDGPGVFRVEIAAQPGVAAELFVEAQQPWFFDVGAFEPAVDGRKAGFAVRAVQRPRNEDGTEIVMTLVTRDGASLRAIEVRSRLDIGRTAP